jgi:hypothetical protein
MTTTIPTRPAGEFHDQRDAKWIVIKGQLWCHNDTPFGRPTLGRPIGRPGGFGHPQSVYGVLHYYQLLVTLFFNIVTLIVEFTLSDSKFVRIWGLTQIVIFHVHK